MGGWELLSLSALLLSPPSLTWPGPSSHHDEADDDVDDEVDDEVEERLENNGSDTN